MTYFMVSLVKLYQRLISPFLGPRCRFHPTCSQYTIESFERHGFIKGGLLSTWRILRCGPWSSGGVDQVPH